MPHPYKHAVISAFVIFTCIIQATRAQSPQVSYLLDNTQSGSTKNYIARDEIVMKPGFVYSATGSNTFSAKIDAGLLFPPTENTYALPNGTITTDPTQGAVVGSIPGQFTVSPSGAATYTIPIECPPGINGMQPSVVLVYNSQLPVGLLGRGFDLACSSTITRIPHSLYYDNDSHSVAFDGHDRFALDGMRLISDDNSTYNSTGAIYFTENNQTSRITSIGTLGDGPESFKVETSDGKTMEYGNTNDSKLILPSETGAYIWYLKKVTDNNGNPIVYNYSKINDETVLSSIQYTGGSVEFSYNTSTTKNNYYVNGNEIKNTAFLERIRVKGLNDYLRNYSFNGINSNGQFLLSEIKEYYNKNGRDLSEINTGEQYFSVNPIKFNWTNSASSTFSNNLVGGLNIVSAPCYLDFNGDGLDDVFLISKTGTPGNEVYTQKIFQNTGSGKTETFSQVITAADPDLGIETNEIKQLNSSVNSFADINGDGKTDLIYKIKSNNGGNYTYSIRVRGLNNEIGYCTIFQKSYPNLYEYKTDLNGTVRKSEFKVIYGDFDGDGNTEILVIQDNNNCWLVKYAQGALIKTAVTTNGVNLYDIADDIKIGDFDGDGKMDFGCNINNQFKTYKIVNNSIVEIYAFNSTIKYVADINQDGMTDLIKFVGTYGEYDSVLNGDIFSLTYTVYFRKKNNTFNSENGVLLTGNTFSNYVRENFPYFSGEAGLLSSTEIIQLSDVRFEDTDGDGILNIILLYDKIYNFTSEYEGDGSTVFNEEQKTIIGSFFEKPEIFTQPGVSNPSSYWRNSSGHIAVGSYCENKFNIDPRFLNPEYDRAHMDKEDISSTSRYKQLLTANINANGKRSFFIIGTRRTVLGIDVYSCIEKSNIYLNRNLISSIEDAYGNKTNITYKIPEQIGTAQTFPYFTYRTGSPVVNTVTISNISLNFNRTSTYSFTNEVFHRVKGFLGYLNTSVTDPDGIIQSTTGILNTNFGIIIPHEESSIIKKTTTDVTVVDKLNKRYWIRPDKVTAINYLSIGESNALKITKTFETYDTNGNPTSIKTEYGDGTGVSSTESYNTYIQKGAWYANKPLIYSIVKKCPNVPNETRTKDYTYYDNGNLKSEISDNGNADNLQLTQDFVYDSFGNLTQISITAKDLNTGADVVRTSTMTYPTGRFLETKTNPLGQETTYHWNAENGLLTSEDSKLSTDSPVRTTSYSYDIWGRLIEIIYPDGVRKTQVMQWAEPENALKAKYFVYSQISGTAPVRVWYDALGREVSKETYGLNGNKVSVFTEYNPDGRVKQVSEPTFNASAEAWAQYDFIYNSDPFKRVTSVKTPNGTITNTYGKTSTTTLTVNTPDGSKTTTQETTLNNAGQKISSKINGKEVTYTFYASGLPKTSTPSGGQTLTMVYDIQGNRISLNDPDAGIVESKYNGFGELIEEKQKMHDNTHYITTTNTFKANGLLDKIVRNNNEITTYSYDTKNRVSKIEISATNKQEFSYDSFDRITNVKETVGARTFEHKTEYDFYGRVKKHIYPTGYYTLNKYDEYGNLTEVTDKENRPIWKVINENARGQITNISKGEKITTYGFDPITGFPTSTFASGIINYSYVFNNLGNLIERNDNNATQKEKFVYDTQERLTEWDVYQNITTLAKHNYITYNATTSNITAKNDLGLFTMSYGGNRPDGSAIGPHALATISGVPTNFPQIELPNYPTAELSVTYTDFKKIATLNEKNKDYYLTYGVDDQRRMSVYKIGGVTQLTRYYIGDYEEELLANNNVRKIHYLSGAILIQETNQPDKLYYTYADFQGSLLALTDENGNLLEKYAYDPWGARRNPTDWTQKDSRTSWIVNRGYTGHEHLDAFGIINMNGRVYDPLTAQFFSPDPNLDGSNWLSYNRYGYCLNNPFKYSDPSGNTPLLAAAFVGGFINVFTQGLSGNINSFGDFLMSFGVGALAGLTGAWIGGLVAAPASSITSISAAITNAGTMGATAGAAGGFVIGTGNAWMSGASFEDGLKAGLVGAGTGFITGGGLGVLAGGANIKNFLNELNHSTDLASIYVVDVNTGSITQTSPIGGSDFNIYATGVWSDGGTAFELYSTHIINGANTINSFRFWESTLSTISAFHIPVTGLSGYFLERPGPSTKTPNLSLRIPEGSYNLAPNTNSYPDCYKLGNKDVSFDRGITIHEGNFPKNTTGCLLPGSGWKANYVSGSRSTRDLINAYIRTTGYRNIKLNIFEEL